MTLPNPDEPMVTVYTTMQPDVPLKVSEAERDELAAQGLLARQEGDEPEVTPAEEAREARQRPATGRPVADSPQA
jgi:hypothetical protein